MAGLRISIISRRMPYPFCYDGGAERSVGWLAAVLANFGYSVRVLGSYLRSNLSIALVACRETGCVYSSSPKGSVCTNYDGVQVSMVPRELFQIEVQQDIESGPDLIITQLEHSEMVISIARARRVPVILRLVGPWHAKTYPPIDTSVLPVANSPLTAQVATAYYGRSVGFILTPIPSVVCKDEFDNATLISFVNPRKEKGLHLFTRIAALRPRLPFLVVGGWRTHPLTSDELDAVNYLKRLPNVSFSAGFACMSANVFAKSRCLLVPSRWPESWPRVVGEAHRQGIPVLGSEIGCTPHAVGMGGIILPYGDPELWCRTLDRVYDDGELRSKLHRAAATNILRFSESGAIAFWREAVHAAIKGDPWSRYAKTTVKILRAERSPDDELHFKRDQIAFSDPIRCQEPHFA